MFSRTLSLLWFAATLNVTAALAQTAAAPAPAPSSGGIRISIKNVYDVKLNFGPLGNGSRKGTDMAEGVLRRQGAKYDGVVTASVDSEQHMSGIVSTCPQGHYEGSQELKVTGLRATGFTQIQTVVFTGQTALFNQATGAGRPSNASNEFLMLEFAPQSMASGQTVLRVPPQDENDPFLDDLVVECHTLIDTESGIAFLPLNDTRWTTKGTGYVIALPSSGVLNYKDTTVPIATGTTVGPFEVKQSLWTIQVERLP